MACTACTPAPERRDELVDVGRQAPEPDRAGLGRGGRSGGEQEEKRRDRSPGRPRPGTLRTRSGPRGRGAPAVWGQALAGVEFKTISGAHIFRHVSRRFYRMQDPGPFFLGSHKGSYGTLGRARPASAAAQGLADLGGPRRADGRRDGRPPPPGPGTIGLCRLRCRRAARAPGFKRNLFAPPPAPSSRQRGGISWRDRRLDTGPFVGRPH